jgi:hypothetical protein
VSVFYGVRLTDEMDAKVQATGRGKSAVVQDALELYFNGWVDAPKQIITEKPKEPSIRVVRAKPIVRETDSAKDEPTPAKAGPCPRCEGPTIAWNPSLRRCQKCAQNWPM